MMPVENWPLTELGDILAERREEPDPVSLESGLIRVVSKIGFNEGRIQLRNDGATKTGMILIRPGDLVLSGINAIKGAIAIYDETATEPVAATIHYGAFRPKKGRVETRFLWWLLRSRSFRNILLEHLPGGIKTELKANRFLAIPIHLPPFAEQQRIVARIEALAQRVEEAQGLRIQSIREAKIVTQKGIDFAIAEAVQFRPLKELLSEPLVNGLSLPSSQIGSEGIAFAKVGIVNTGKFNPVETKRVNIKLTSHSPFWMRSNDIFVSRGNSSELVGRAAVYDGVPADLAFPDLLIRVRVNSAISNPRFVAAYFHSRPGRAYIESQASGTSPSMKKVSQPKLEQMPIPVLTISEQDDVVAYLDRLQASVDRLRRLQAETQKELDALMPSILAKAFAGEL